MLFDITLLDYSNTIKRVRSPSRKILDLWIRNNVLNCLAEKASDRSCVDISITTGDEPFEGWEFEQSVMKPFEYYSETKTPYPNDRKYKIDLVEQINNTPMTAAEREQALAGVEAKAREWMNEAVKPYNIERRRLTEEFWADCRNHYGYEGLTEGQISLIESQAYEDGHSSGFSSVFSELGEILEFVREFQKRS